MDAPPPQEDVRPYVAVAGDAARVSGFSAPEIYAEDARRGFLLIEDFGDDTYTRLLADGADEAALYALAVDTLVALQRAVEPQPACRRCRPMTRSGCSPRRRCWSTGTRPAVLGAPLPEAARDEYLARWRDGAAASRNLPAPTLVLRDYHVDNLMLLPGPPGRARAAGCSISRTR